MQGLGEGLRVQGGGRRIWVKSPGFREEAAGFKVEVAEWRVEVAECRVELQGVGSRVELHRCV